MKRVKREEDPFKNLNEHLRKLEEYRKRFSIQEQERERKRALEESRRIEKQDEFEILLFLIVFGFIFTCFCLTLLMNYFCCSEESQNVSNIQFVPETERLNQIR